MPTNTRLTNAELEAAIHALLLTDAGDWNEEDDHLIGPTKTALRKLITQDRSRKNRRAVEGV